MILKIARSYLTAENLKQKFGNVNRTEFLKELLTLCNYQKNYLFILFIQSIIISICIQIPVEIIINHNITNSSSVIIFSQIIFVIMFMIWGIEAKAIPYILGINKKLIYAARFHIYSFLPLTLIFIIYSIIENLFILNRNIYLLSVSLIAILITLIVKFYTNYFIYNQKKVIALIATNKLFYTNKTEADNYFKAIFKKIDDNRFIKIGINDEFRNAFIISYGITKFSLSGDFFNGTLRFIIGIPEKFNEKRQFIEYIKIRNKNDLLLRITGKDIFTGWNVFETNSVQSNIDHEIICESTFKEHIFLSIEKKKKKIVRKITPQVIIVIIVDSLVPQCIGIYQNDPNKDGLSRFFNNEFSSVFVNAYSQGDWTLPTMASLAVSKYPSLHDVTDPNIYSRKINLKTKTIGEYFQDNGFKTFCYSQQKRYSPGYGHARGYDNFIYRRLKQKAYYTHKDVTWSSLKFLQDNKDDNLFLQLQYLELHRPYSPIAENITKFNLENKNNLKDFIIKKESFENLDKENIERLRRHYYEKFLEIDRSLTILFDYIEKNLSKNTSVIVTSDHGDRIFDDKYGCLKQLPKNNRIKIDCLTHVPYMVRFYDKKLVQKKFVDEIIEANNSILPTTLNIANIAVPKSIAGKSVIAKENMHIGKGYSISELIYENNYELILRTPTYRYIIICLRDAKKNKIIKNTMVHKLIENRNSMINKNEVIHEIKSIFEKENLNELASYKILANY